MGVLPCRMCGQWECYLVRGVVSGSVTLYEVWSVGVLPCRCGQWGCCLVGGVVSGGVAL